MDGSAQGAAASDSPGYRARGGGVTAHADDLVPDLETDFQNYYDALMRPYRDKVLAAVDRIKDLMRAASVNSGGLNEWTQSSHSR